MTEQRTIAAAQVAAENLETMIQRLHRRGQATSDELARLDRQAGGVVQRVRAAHRDQRIAESVMRTGRVAVWITREFGPPEDYILDEHAGA